MHLNTITWTIPESWFRSSTCNVIQEDGTSSLPKEGIGENDKACRMHKISNGTVFSVVLSIEYLCLRNQVVCRQLYLQDYPNHHHRQYPIVHCYRLLHDLPSHWHRQPVGYHQYYKLCRTKIIITLISVQILVLT